MSERSDAALREICEILRVYGDDCTVTQEPGRVKLTNSYRVRSRKERLRICSILADSDLTERKAKNLSAEWRFHNVAYALHVHRASAKDADLDYVQDERRLIRTVTKLFEALHLY